MATGELAHWLLKVCRQDDGPKALEIIEASVRWRLDVAALEQVIEPADPIPAIAVSLEQQVFSLPVRLMVVSGSRNVHIFP